MSRDSEFTSRRSSKSFDSSHHSNESNNSDCSWDCSEHTDRNHCHDKCHHRRRRCGLRFSNTPVGVWNLLYQYDITSPSMVTTSSTTTVSGTTGTTVERPTQLLLNEGGTFINATTPDLNNNPFGALLSLGMGVWREIDNRKLRLDETHVAFRASNGSPTVYYRVEIIMKLSRSGTQARFFGRAVPKDITDPTLCTDTDGQTFCFSGCGYKVLEPNRK